MWVRVFLLHNLLHCVPGNWQAPAGYLLSLHYCEFELSNVNECREGPPHTGCFASSLESCAEWADSIGERCKTRGRGHLHIQSVSPQRQCHQAGAPAKINVTSLLPTTVLPVTPVRVIPRSIHKQEQALS